MGLIFIICGLSCALFRTPQATTASVIISTLIGKIPNVSTVLGLLDGYEANVVSRGKFKKLVLI